MSRTFILLLVMCTLCLSVQAQVAPERMTLARIIHEKAQPTFHELL
jgi:hypothetical protein